jgi:hypothetical protein
MPTPDQANGATPATQIPVPKVLPPAHPDRFTPGNQPGPQEEQPAAKKQPISPKPPSAPQEKP